MIKSLHMQGIEPQFTGISACRAKDTQIFWGHISNKKIMQWLM
jgi:hypothetical protein